MWKDPTRIPRDRILCRGKDITGQITTEINTVRKHGGQVLFTEDITFSSSNLINRFMNLYPDNAQESIQKMRQRIDLEQLISELQKIKNKQRVLIIGDTILDEYIYVEPLGKPSKENIIATRFRDREIFCGGVVATGNLLAQFCGEVDMLTLLGETDSEEDFIRGSLHPTIRIYPFYRKGAPTTKKSRLVDPNYVHKLFEVAYLDDRPLEEDRNQAMLAWLEERIADYDLVIANDFGHGMIEDEVVNLVREGVLPGGQRPDQQRQQRLQSHHQVSTC